MGHTTPTSNHNEPLLFAGEERRAQNANIERRLFDIQQSVDLILSAFPEGDVDGHRRYHEAKIRAALAEEKFWLDLKAEAAKRGVFFVFTVLFGLILLGLSVKLGVVGVSSK